MDKLTLLDTAALLFWAAVTLLLILNAAFAVWLKTGHMRGYYSYQEAFDKEVPAWLGRLMVLARWVFGLSLVLAALILVVAYLTSRL